MTMQDNENSRLEQLRETALLSINFKAFNEFNFDKVNGYWVLFYQLLLLRCGSSYENNNGWFYHSQEQIKRAIGISRNNLETVVKNMEAMGILEVEARQTPSRTANPVKLHYRLRFDVLARPEILKQIYRQPTRDQVQLFTELANSYNTEPPRPPRQKQERKQPRKTKRKSLDPAAIPTDILPPDVSTNFRDAWTILMQSPKWKGKRVGLLQRTIQQLQAFDERYAIMLIENAAMSDYNNVVFEDTQEKYERWKQRQPKPVKPDPLEALLKPEVRAERGNVKPIFRFSDSSHYQQAEQDSEVDDCPF